jgi:hypothetical protein
MKQFLQNIWDLLTLSTKARMRKEALKRRMTRGAGPYPGRKDTI